MEHDSPALAFSGLLRIADEKKIRQYLSPERVAVLEETKFEQLYRFFTDVLKRTVTEIGAPPEATAH